MNHICDDCHKAYDDFDHLTYCPHDYFEKPKSIEEILSLLSPEERESFEREVLHRQI